MSAEAGTRAEQKAETRRRVLDVARRHLERDGYEAASFRAIAEEAGVAVGTVVLHFGDKKGVLHAALYDDLEDAMARCLSRGTRGSLPKRLADLFEPAFEYYAQRPRLSRTLLASSLFADPPWRERFGSQVIRLQGRIGELFESAKTRGEVADEADGLVFATAVFSFYYLTLIGWAQGVVPTPLTVFRSLVEQHLRGVAP